MSWTWCRWNGAKKEIKVKLGERETLEWIECTRTFHVSLSSYGRLEFFAKKKQKCSNLRSLHSTTVRMRRRRQCFESMLQGEFQCNIRRCFVQHCRVNIPSVRRDDCSTFSLLRSCSSSRTCLTRTFFSVKKESERRETKSVLSRARLSEEKWNK